MVILKNDALTVKINELGAEIKSIVFGGKEQMWEGREEVWSGTAPLLFPICGALKDDKYTFGGKEYSLPQHGFARKSMFEVAEVCDQKAVFALKSNDALKEVYPFDFELYVTYTIDGSSVKIAYDVKNLTDGEMYFSIGSHEAYYTPEGVEDYDIIFPQKETLSTYLLCGRNLAQSTMPILKDSNVLPIYEKYFMIDSLVFDGLKSHSAILRNRKTGREIKLEFPYTSYLLVWHKPNSPYLCIEPWSGVADFVSTSYDITQKRGIIKLEKGESYYADHSITF